MIGRALLAEMLEALEADPALADRARRVLGAPAPDDLVPLDEAATIASARVRVLLDECRRERLELVGRRGHRRVRRAELIRWMMTRRATTTKISAVVTDERAEARAAVAAAAARAARGAR